MSGKTRRCQRCHEVKPWSAYRAKRNMRCRACEAELRQPCRICGEPVPLPRGRTSVARTVCDDPVCQAAVRSEAGQKHRATGPKRCPVCGVTKPRTRRYWSITADGKVYGYCRPCATGDNRARMEADEVARAKVRDRARHQRERIRQRRAADPAFDREYRVRQVRYAADKRKRDRLKAQQPHTFTNTGRAADDEVLPSGPLVAVIERIITVRMAVAEPIEGDTFPTTREAVCESLGTTLRALSRWRSGENVTVPVADRILVHADLQWWDVWPPDEYPDVARVWEGDVQATA